MTYSYVIYPWLLKMLAFIFSKKENEKPKTKYSFSILMAVHNEEAVIEQKLISVFNSFQQIPEFEFLIGSDASTDGTEKIIKQFAITHPEIKLIRFNSRTGKPAIINALTKQSKFDLLVLTDANILFEKNAVEQLVKNFSDPKCGLAGANIVSNAPGKQGIAIAEVLYVNSENKLKQLESDLFNKMIGPFGGLYAIRKNLFKEIPAHFLVDDFYWWAAAVQKKFYAVFEKKSVATELVIDSWHSEFNRKKRIGAGNFQNLFRFPFLLNVFSAVGFCFVSHKLIRWLGPFLLLGALASTSVLALHSEIFFLLSIVQAIPLLILMIYKSAWHANKPIRFIAYFYSMNLALLIGFFNFLAGVKSGTWNPTKRI